MKNNVTTQPCISNLENRQPFDETKMTIFEPPHMLLETSPFPKN